MSIGGVSHEESSCSEEEVFEGYVVEDTITGGHGMWEEPTDDAHEVPAHVLTELKNVLTIRKHEREMKKMRRRGHQPRETFEASEGTRNISRLQQEGIGPVLSCQQEEKTSATAGHQNSTPDLSQDPTPLSENSTPLTQDPAPLSQDSTPGISQDPTPLSQGTTPPSQDSTHPTQTCTHDQLVPPADRFLLLSLSAEMAAAIKKRKPTHKEDIFS